MAAAITFAIPYLHNPDYLREAVRSVFAQTITDWQLIVVDDASDEPPQLDADTLADPRFTVVRNQRRLGLGANWNRCVSLAPTPLVSLLHADDRLTPCYGAAVVAAADRWPTAAAVFTAVNVIGPTGERTTTLADQAKRLARRPDTREELRGDAALSAILAVNYLYSPSLCYRRDWLVEHPFDESLAMVLDLDWIARTIMSGQSLAFVPLKLYDYRRHRESTSAQLTDNSQRFHEELALYRRLAQQADAVQWPATRRAAQRRLMVRSHMAHAVLRQVATGSFGNARSTLRLLTEDLHGRATR